MNQNCLTPIEIYINKVYKFLILIIPSIALCAGGTFTVLYLMGYYPDVNAITITVFDITCVFYTLMGLYFNRNCEDKNGQIRPDMLLKGKIAIAALMCVQWNFISYMIPSRDFWAYSFYFVVLAVSFLDSKYILIIIAEISVSMIVSWIVRPDEMLPVKDGYFVPELVLRIVLIVLFFLAIWLLTSVIERRFVKELEKISDYDTLTMLHNRRRLENYMNEAAKRTDGNFSVIMSDIDNFKKVNDTYGHECGDEILKNIANILRSVTFNKGMVFRYGGEEMLTIIYAGEAEAFELAEKIRKKTESFTTFYGDSDIKVTLTSGVAAYTGKETNEELIKLADTNLYYGKSHGKNCVIK